VTSEDTIGLLSMDKPRSLPARFHDAFIEADIPMIFTTNKKPKKIFPARGELQAARGDQASVCVRGGDVVPRPSRATHDACRKACAA
jgi:hypothetical protein